jgi:hypothetical protein
MSTELDQMAAPVELHDEREDYDEEECPHYNCAYCKSERGYDFMEEMCADCYWDYDSLRKQPRRILTRMLLPENTERHEEMQGWFNDAKQRLADFEERLAAGQDYTYPEREETAPKSLEELAKEDLQEQIEELNQRRTQLRNECCGREMTPEEAAQSEAMERSVQALVNEYTTRNL